jgi:putative exporter of polyketide antibiotics
MTLLIVVIVAVILLAVWFALAAKRETSGAGREPGRDAQRPRTEEGRS